MVAESRGRGESQTGGAAAAHDGLRDDLSQAPAESAASRASCVPLLVTRRADHAGEPRLEYGHHVYPAPWWVHLPGRRDGLVQSVCPLVGGVDHDGRGLLSGSVGPRPGGGTTGNLQQ